ncbi:hypothetical protein SDC9_113397 [bioreactor metagenome]|uniref:Uncharacterized protein n=1 Tax=bioreactor metagenome TaxID=1076179 RepID=A0A645BLY2_9ZZZZ
MFPKHILLIASATPPPLTEKADKTLLAFISSVILLKFFFKTSKSGISSLSLAADTKTTLLFALLNSEDTIFSALFVATANATTVGGTLKSLNVPDILSLPPIAGIANSLCACNAPKSAAKGFPHFSDSLPSFSKYS